MIRLVVSYPVKSANKFVYKSWKAYWGYKTKVHEHLDREFKSFLKNTGKKRTSVIGNTKICITSIRDKFLDYDNLVAGCKPYLDWLSKNGLIYDDNPNEVEISIDQKIRSNKTDVQETEQHTIIRLYK